MTDTTSTDALRTALLQDRLASYVRLRGGFPIPLAGAVYWGVLGTLGYSMELPAWSMTAFVGSGAIFPMAILFARLFRNDFMRDRTATGDVLIPTFIGMLLFWPMIVAAVREGPQLIPLILAIGLSLHWPVIGWSYGRTALYATHAVVRAALALAIWLALPDARLTLLPLSVAAVYLATVVAILLDARRVEARLANR
jgi:hypothetical protein